MKTAYINQSGITEKVSTWLAQVKEIEKTDRSAAIDEYKKMVLAFPLSEEVYDRLMILYRLEKEPKEELRWINKAIQTFEKSFLKTNIKPKKNSKINALSKSILRSTGLVDSKGKALFQPQPISRWQKRKDLLQARLARNS